MPGLDLRVLVLERKLQPGSGFSAFVQGAGSARKVGVWVDGQTLAWDANLHWDDTNDRLGVGTDTPSAPLTVRSLTPLADLATTWAAMRVYPHTSAATTDTIGLRVEPPAVTGAGSISWHVGVQALDPVVAVGTAIAFHGAMSAGANRWNLYMQGTAANYLLGDTGIGGVPYAGFKLNVENGLRSGGRLDVGGTTTLQGTFLVNNSSTFNGLVGIGRAPNSSYWITAANAKIDTLYADRALVGWGDVAGYELVTNRLYAAGTSQFGYANFGMYVGINSGYDPRWSLYVNGPAYTAGVQYVYEGLRLGYWEGGVAGHRLYVDSGYSYFGGNVAILRNVDSNWRLCLAGGSSLYCDGAAFIGTGLTVNGQYGLTNSGTSQGGGVTETSIVHVNVAWNELYLFGHHTGGSHVSWQFRVAGESNKYDFRMSGANAYIQSGSWVDAASDRRVKRNIVPLDTPLERLGKLQGCVYDRTDLLQAEGFPLIQTREIGLIAQDVAAALPEAAFEHDYEGEQGVLWNYYDRAILALLVQSVNALHTKVQALEAQA